MTVHRLRTIKLASSAEEGLTALQMRVNAVTQYSERVAVGRRLFESANRGNNATFKAVRSALHDMCCGARRCMYCEDSAAAEIDHFYPKSLFPSFLFAWMNFLYACGPCNRAKANHFRMLAGDEAFVDVVSSMRYSEEPSTGPAALINPRLEDPAKYLQLDVIDTFFFLPRFGISARELMRAQYTIALLALNDRDILPAARREAYMAYRARLVEYVSRRGSPEANRVAGAISNCAHPTVWSEMKAQRDGITELSGLFQAAPEALTW